MPGDTAHKCGEEQRRDDHFDQAQEYLAQHLHMSGGMRPQVAEQSGHYHADENPGGEGTPQTKFHRSPPSSSTLVSVFESRYFTITGVYSERPHSLALPLVMARLPGTTTAFSGTTNGESALERITFSCTRS